MVFAHLVHSQLEPLLEFLCSLPGPTGKPALEFVMTEWMSRQHLFYGQYEGKVRSGNIFSQSFRFRLTVLHRLVMLVTTQVVEVSQLLLPGDACRVFMS